MTNKEVYAQLCQEQRSTSIYDQPWWLDAVCGPEHWDVLIYEKNGKLLGAMPYYTKSRYGLSYITNPPLTQHNRIYVHYPPQQKYEARLASEKEVFTALIKQMKNVCGRGMIAARMSLDPGHTNWLPFYWQGFYGRTNYTYILPSASFSYEDLQKSYSKVIRYDAKKALDFISIQESDDLKTFYRLHCQMFARQHQSARLSYEFLEKFDKCLLEHSARRMLIAKDTDNIPYSAAYFVYDRETVYYLLSGTDPQYRKFNTLTALITEGIRFASQTGRNFDFEGSMVENIESYFRKFGAVQIPYFRVSKIFTQNPVMRGILEKKFR